MNVIELTSDTFDETIGAHDVVIVDFWATWCGPCRAFAPVFEAASGENPDVTFAKVDVDAHPELSTRLGIQSIPTLVAFRAGEQVLSRTGAMPAAALSDVVTEARG